MWHEFISAKTTDEVVESLARQGKKARIIAGGTDLILELERKARPGLQTLIDVTRISGLDEITLDEDGVLHIGAMVTHNQIVASKLLRERAYPLVRACWEVGSPQIRNRGTVAGNLVTASPANDTITPLMALDAWLVLKSVRGERRVPLSEFYQGVRKSVLQPDEMLTEIGFKGMESNQSGTFIKMALRRAQAISVANIAIILTLDGETVTKAAITLGAVSPTIIHAPQAETYLQGKKLSDEVIAEAAILARQAAHPIDDIRGSAAYRREMTRVIASRGLESIRNNETQAGFPAEPVLLWGRQNHQPVTGFEGAHHTPGVDIQTTINGKQYSFQSGYEKTLLHLLREEAGLIGSKEGCAEGECGSCTVFLDGQAVLSCLVPAARAHNAEIVTVEGLANAEQLHPVQEAFVHEGAVQCGYCTPGFLMSAAKLLEERPNPDINAIEQAITGNLCRCTGYYKIIKAIEAASKYSVKE
ncbi:MAG: FAD binding domain-containing protein [Anaerolineales bacterium]|jgi:carbon-monoxide dehydrogenase medium subunit|nr:FAD binding domain-containing protein [Anaerolineales bacterium]